MSTFTKPSGIERRTITAELRTAGDEFALMGFAATYNSWSKDLGGFRECLKPGAFARSIRSGADVHCLFNHAPDHILGRTKSGTLRLEDRAAGLWFRCDLDRNSQKHRDIYASVKRRDISECSFAFSVPAGGQSWTTNSADGMQERTLTDVDLIDVSPVTYPAYTETAVDARSHQPDYRASRIPQTDKEKLVYARKMFRRAAAAMGKSLVAAQRDSGSQLDFASTISGHLDLAHSFLEAAFVCSQTARDTLDQFDADNGYQARGQRADDDEFDPDEGYRAFNEMHKLAHASISVSSDYMADCRLAHGKAFAKPFVPRRKP